MAGFLSVANSNVYHSFISAETGGIKNGVFVTPNYADGTVKLAGANDTDVYFVVNENTNAPEWGIDDVDFEVKTGKFVRAHKPSVGEVLVTTHFADGLKKGDTVGVGANGEVVASANGMFVVKDETTAYGEAALSLQTVKSEDAAIA